MVLTERDYKQIEMESLIEREFSRILRLTRMREDNVTSYVGHIHRVVFSRHGTSEKDIHASIPYLPLLPWRKLFPVSHSFLLVRYINGNPAIKLSCFLRIPADFPIRSEKIINIIS